MPKKIFKLFRKSLCPIVQGDSCPSEFCPMTQFSIETIVQWKQSPDFYAILTSRMVGRLEEKSKKIWSEIYALLLQKYKLNPRMLKIVSYNEEC